jgi:hypothetical protein
LQRICPLLTQSGHRDARRETSCIKIFMAYASWVTIVNPGSVRVSGCAGLSAITKVEPGCISAVTRCAISGARLILFIVSEAIRAEASSIFVPDGKPIASHLRRQPHSLDRREPSSEPDRERREYNVERNRESEPAQQPCVAPKGNIVGIKMD